ncbi:hypothetical protein DQ04_09681040, partial [Trypanosoma grayi]|uniref:hypothetical protein n=1 Tax=Trypanosoma grayi TaxID=71804 RepID=UPI0004F45BDD
LAPATPVICSLHEGREVEYLESVTLKSLGITTRSPHTWLEVVLSGNCDAPHCQYYYSSLVCLSQREKPEWLPSTDTTTCHLSELSSICPRLRLRNPQWTEHGSPYSKLLRSRAAALVLMRRPDLQGNIDVILRSYNKREESLLKLLTVGP